MKKLLILAVSMLTSISSFAQIGIIGGLTSSSTNVTLAAQELSTGTANQFHVGVTYKIGLGNLFALQPALIYNVKGASIANIKSISDINFKTGFIELPAQVQIGGSVAKILRLYGIVEPFIGYAVSNNMSSTSGSSNDWDNVKNRFEYGISLGGGIEIIKHFQINLKYFWNLGSIYGSEVTISTLTYQISNSKCKGLVLSGVVLF